MGALKQDQPYSEVIGMPGVAYAQDDRYFDRQGKELIILEDGQTLNADYVKQELNAGLGGPPPPRKIPTKMPDIIAMLQELNVFYPPKANVTVLREIIRVELSRREGLANDEQYGKSGPQ